MKELHIPVGIYDKEIFIIRLVDGKPYCGIDNKPVFDVIRPVEEERLEFLRNQDAREDEYKGLWKAAVAENATEEGFQDWFDGVWDDEFDEDDPEDFPCKDDGGCQYLAEDLRLAADGFLHYEYGINVGTWESAGNYGPGDFNDEPFKGWDYVFNAPLSEKWAKYYEDMEK